MDRTEAATVWQARAEFLAAQLEMARDEIKALAAPPSPPETPGPPEPVEPTPEARWSRLRTWAPWLLGLLAIMVAVGLVVWPR
jgi:hypothetical protein